MALPSNMQKICDQHAVAGVETGSGPGGKPLDHYFCANNHASSGVSCLNAGTLRCSSCGLAGYCSKECQRSHWKIHRSYCKKLKYRDDHWEPRWIQESRLPQFMDPFAQFKQMGMGLQLWGNTPAVDIINFENNEMKDGALWDNEMNLAFIASGDFRFLVETLASVPESYAGPIDIVINDLMPFVVARNLLMTCLLLLEGDNAIEAVINVWYSTALPNAQYSGPIDTALQKLFPIIETGSGKIEQEGSTIELSNLTEPLMILKEMSKNKVDIEDALRMRNSLMVNPSRRDFYDRHLLTLKPFHRESFDRFRTLGLLLPYECSSSHHNTPNKFLLSTEHGWMLDDSADPKEGWDLVKVMNFGDGKKLPINDLYGRLFFYIRDRLTKMVATIRRVPTTIRFFQKDARELADHLQEMKVSFDRIEVSNVCDENYIGIERLLDDWEPLLNQSNPNSAIVSLFLNWYHLNKFENDSEVMATSGIRHKAMSMLGIEKGSPRSPVEDVKESIMFLNACQLIADNTMIFKKYLESCLGSKKSYVKRRMDHKIVPHRIMFPLGAKPDTTADSFSKEEQYILLNWSVNHVNRYVEWGLR